MCVYDFKNIESLSKLYQKLNALSLDEGNTYNNINSFHINSLVQSYLYNVDFMNMMVWILSIILILTLIIVVRSCSKNDSSVQQKNGTEKIATPKQSPDSLTKSTKDTLNK